MSDSTEQFLGIIDNRIEKHLNSNTSNYIKQRLAKVIEVDDDTQRVYVYFIDDENQTQYTYYNKTNETISSGDNVKVFYSSDIVKGWIGERTGEPNVRETSYGGEGVGRPSPWDITSEYFNAYGVGTPTNIAGTKGKTGYFATAKGFATEAKGQYSSAEGYVNTISDSATAGHVEGYFNQLYGKYSHVEGYFNRETNPEIEETPSSECNHMEGKNNVITNSEECHIEGYNNTINSSKYSHVEGYTCTIGNSSNTHINGEYCGGDSMSHCTITGESCHIIMTENTKAHACFVGGQYSNIKSSSCTDSLVYGYSNTISGNNNCSTVLGGHNTLSGSSSYNLITGYSNTVKNTYGALVSGQQCGVYDKADEGHTIKYPIVLGSSCFAYGDFAHAEGDACNTEKSYSFAFGRGCKSKGESDILMGSYLTSTSTGSDRTIIGKYNNSDNIDNMLFIIGNGGQNETGKIVYSNAFTVDKEGNVTCKSINGITPGGSSDALVPYTTEQAISSAESIFGSVMEV